MDAAKLKWCMRAELGALNTRIEQSPAKLESMSQADSILNSNRTATDLSTQVFHLSSEALLILDESFWVLQANASAIRLFAKPLKALASQPLRDIFEASDHRDLLFGQHEQPDEVSSPVLYELVLHRDDARSLYVEAYLTRIQESPTRFLLSLRDASQREASHALELTLARDRESSKILREFIEAASHEFKTPLSIINTKLYLIRRKGVSNEDLDAISRQVERVNSLVDSLTMMLNLDVNTVLDLSAVEIGPLLQGLAEQLAARLEREQKSLEVFIPPDLPRITGNEDSLYTALRQLLDNALRFTSPGDQIRVSAELSAEWVRIAIEDTGIGMDAEHLPHIFERFYRIDHSRQMSGMGLGLSIVERIIELHDGWVDVSSTPGQGSCFEVWLPCQHQALPPP